MKAKGQALTEFAIFGSILLMCVAMLLQYGLQSNYQQQLQMEAFREAQRMAFNSSGPNASKSVSVVRHKAFPDPRDQFGYAEHSPMSASESVVWDTDQNAQYVKHFNDTPKTEDLPSVYFDIESVDKNTMVDTTHTDKTTGVVTKGKSSINSLAATTASQNTSNAFGFSTARFDRSSLPGKIDVVHNDPKHSNPLNTKRTEYYSTPVYSSQIVVARVDGGFGDTETNTNSQLLMSPYYRPKADSVIKERITEADLDGDGMANLQEYLAGTDPSDAKSVLKLIATRGAGASVALSFKVVPGRSYTLEYLEPGTNGWQRLNDFVAGPGAKTTAMDDLTSGNMRWYRVRTPKLP